MIGIDITAKNGEPLAGGKKLEKSSYQPNDEVKKLWARCQSDYQIAWRLQHRPFDEFDGMSLLQRARKDQETFGAFVGAEYIPEHKRWRWRGRKNTARNKLIGLLSHMISGMLFPNIRAQNEEDEPDKDTAEVMRLLVEQHLRKARYESKFLYMALSALVNPATIVEVEYVEAIQRIKKRLENGQIQVVEAVDTLLSGLNLNVLPIDQFLIGDFFTGELQRQPFVIKVRRLPWDTARKMYSGKYFDESGTDLFNYVEAGKTRIVMTGQEHLTLYDIEWSEADRYAVQELTFYYRDEDAEFTFVGGVYIGNTNNVYNSNPFSHRRMSLIGEELVSIPVYPFAKSGFEPIDPTGRFFYYKSGAFKEYWDDATQNKMHQMWVDGTALSVIKPAFISGMAKADTAVMVPGAVVGLPPGADIRFADINANLSAGMVAMEKQESDMADSTLTPIMAGQMGVRQTAYAVSAAVANAKIMLGLFSAMMADLITQVGELTMDCVIQHTTIGALDATVPEALNMKYRAILVRGKEHGHDITNKIVFSSAIMGIKMTEAEKKNREFEMFSRLPKDQREYIVDPYRFARTVFSVYVDTDLITQHAIGGLKARKDEAFARLANPLVWGMVDQEKVINDFILEEYTDDPDRYKKKQAVLNDLMQSIMGDQVTTGAQPTPNNIGVQAPVGVPGGFISPIIGT